MDFMPLLKRIGQIAGVSAPVIVGAFNPLMGAVLTQVLQAEVALGKGAGAEKKKFVLSALPIVVPFIEAMTGKDIVDDEKFTKSVSDLIDAMVAVLNSIQMLPKAEKPAA